MISNASTVASTVKGLQSKINSYKSEVEVLNIDIKNKQREVRLKEDMIKSLSQKIVQLELKTDLHLTEHAVVRYFERIRQVNLDEVRNEILTPALIDQVTKLGGTGKFPYKNFMLVIENYKIVTII